MRNHEKLGGSFTNLTPDDMKRLRELISGDDPFEYDNLKSLAEWYGFSYYEGRGHKQTEDLPA